MPTHSGPGLNFTAFKRYNLFEVSYTGLCKCLFSLVDLIVIAAYF